MFHLSEREQASFQSIVFNIYNMDILFSLQNKYFSRLVYLVNQISYELGEEYELFLAYERLLKESFTMYSPKEAYLQGIKDYQKGLAFDNGLKLYLSRNIKIDESKRLQFLFHQLSKRLSCKNLLSDFTDMYRTFYPFDTHINQFYKAGYYLWFDDNIKSRID